MLKIPLLIPQIRQPLALRVVARGILQPITVECQLRLHLALPASIGTAQPVRVILQAILRHPGSSSCTSGQYWDGSACVTNPLPHPPPTPTPTPEPTPTSDPATMCAQGGGTWTGSACQMAINTSDQKTYYSYYQKQSGSSLAQVFRAFTDLFR